VDLGLKGQNALVIGSNRGIGYQVAETLSAEGVDVALFARNEKRLQEAADKIKRKTGKTPLVLPGDSKKKENIESAVDQTHQKFGGIDILVNSAGGYTPGSFMEITDETFMGLMETKWLGCIRFMRTVIPIMKKQRGGRILNFAGNSGKNPGFPHAGSVNAAITNITKVVSDEVGPDQILVNCIAPGITLTEHSKHIIETQGDRKHISYDDSLQQFISKVPLGFLGEPKDVADIAVFLVSPRNRWISGTAISVDGGTNRAVFG
jgi:3-oxoacyl-[acyl-carrier protein] reductase